MNTISGKPATAAAILLSLTTMTSSDFTSADETGDRAFAEGRALLVEDVAADVARTHQYLGKNQLDPRVMAAIATVPRHKFVPEELRDAAYLNQPLPIGHGQTISQPYIVAIMTDQLGVFDGRRVLEVGTGSGYQAAILAEAGAEVYSIEIVEPLADEAKQTLHELGYENIRLKTGDGYAGWPEHAPFAGIIVTAAPKTVPQPLLDQLMPGGRMIIPVGGQLFGQELIVIDKDIDGTIRQDELLPVRFVPLTRD